MKHEFVRIEPRTHARADGQTSFVSTHRAAEALVKPSVSADGDVLCGGQAEQEGKGGSLEEHYRGKLEDVDRVPTSEEWTRLALQAVVLYRT